MAAEQQTPNGHRADLHFHLLPQVDDGPSSLEESLALARLAVADGTSTVVCTPHVHFVDVATIPDRVRELQSALDEDGIPLRLVAGGELAGGTEVTDSELEIICHGAPGRRWVFLEAPLDSTKLPAFHESAREMEMRGIGIVIAHPERCPTLVSDREALAGLARRGARFAVNASSLTSHHGVAARDAALALLRSPGAHVLASDAHRLVRPPRLSEALEILRQEGLDVAGLADLRPACLLREGL